MRSLPPILDGDITRVDQMRFRRRLLTSTHRGDAEQAVTSRFGLERGGAMSQAVAWYQNIYPGLYEQMAALYTQEPRVKGPSARTIEAVRAARHWVRMQRTQRDVLALREMFVLVDEMDGKLLLRPVYPDLFQDVRPMSTDSNAVGAIGLWLESGAEGWELRAYDLEGPNGATYVRSETDGTSAVVEVERLEGAAYPWVAGGVPYIPGVLYHAAESGYLLDWETGTDVAHGAVSVMVDFTNAAHGHAEASWLQRVAVDGEFAGAEVRDVPATGGAQARTVVVADPSTVLRLTSEDGKQASIQTLTAPADPEALLRYALAQARQVFSSAGVRTPEVTKQASDIRSGYSLAVASEALAALQVAYKQVFGAADCELLHKSALALGEASPGPEAWTVRYRMLRASAAEMAARVKVATDAVEAGLMSRLEAMLTLYPDMTEQEAEEMLAIIDAERVEAPEPKGAARDATEDDAEDSAGDA